MWWHSEAGRAFVAELLVRWLIDGRRWETPAYVRSWRAGLANRARRHGPLPRGEGMARLW